MNSEDKCKTGKEVFIRDFYDNIRVVKKLTIRLKTGKGV
jgi:hypothetical protein